MRGHERAALAIDVLVHLRTTYRRPRDLLKRFDALIFTGGIGETRR